MEDYALLLQRGGKRWQLQGEHQQAADWVSQNRLAGPHCSRADLLSLLEELLQREAHRAQVASRAGPGLPLRRLRPGLHLSRCGRFRVERLANGAWRVSPSPE